MIVDAHPRKEPGGTLYESGLAAGVFVKNPDGSVYEGPVWSLDEHGFVELRLRDRSDAITVTLDSGAPE